VLIKVYFHYYITLELKPFLKGFIKSGGAFFIIMMTLNFLDKYLFGDSFNDALQSSLSIWVPIFKGAVFISLIPFVLRVNSKRQYLKKHELTVTNYKLVHDNWENP
jgi:5-bromo-4-chloroindolyl phosphate hydrolysis protein